MLEEEHAKEVRLYNLAGFFINKYNDAFRNVLDIVVPIRRRQIKNSILSRLLLSLATILAYLWTIGGEITPGQLVVFMTAIVVIQQQMARTAQTLAGHQDVIYVMRELAAWLRMKPDLTPAPAAVQVTQPEWSSFQACAMY